MKMQSDSLAYQEATHHVGRAALLITSVPKEFRETERERFFTKILSIARTRQSEGPADDSDRGASRIVSGLLYSTLNHIPFETFTLIAPPGSVAELSRGISRCFNKKVNIVATPVQPRDELPAFDVWFDPGGAAPLSLMLRQCFATHNYPVVSVQHTMSTHTLLTDYFRPIIELPTFPWDSLLCSSKASARAVRNLLDHVCDTYVAMGNVRRKFNGRIDVIPLPVDTRQFVPGDKIKARRRFKLPKEAFVILFLGWLSATKADLSPFLRAFHELTRQYPHRTLLFAIAGPSDASYKGYLTDVIGSLGLQQSVRMLGKVANEDRPFLYQASDVFFSPSDTLQESFGLTPIEAMSCGIPQIVSDWDGYRETVMHGETGFRLDTLWGPCDSHLKLSGAMRGSKYDHISLGQSVVIDIRQWSTFIKVFLDNPQLLERMGASSRRRAVSEYSDTVVAKDHYLLWQELQTLCSATDTKASTARATLRATQYFKCFSHYATGLLTSQSVITVGHQHAADLQYLKACSQFVQQNSAAIDFNRCSGLLEAIKTSGSIRLSELLKEAKDDTSASESELIRHLLWLAKHGTIFVSQDEAAIGAAQQ